MDLIGLSCGVASGRTAAGGRRRWTPSFRCAALLLCLGSVPWAGVSPAQATTKGLNQIVTPDLQPTGVLSLSYQQQDPYINYPSEVQAELGITPRFEVAVFQALSPSVQVLNTEIGLYTKLPFLLSTGFSNWDTRGTAPQPYLEAGYYTGPHKLMAGAARVGNQTETILGWGYLVSSKVLLQLDYQSGHGNSTTAGFTYTITPQLSLNPAVYISNDAPHHLHPYAVLTWNVQLWKPREPKAPQNTQPPPTQPLTTKPETSSGGS